MTKYIVGVIVVVALVGLIIWGRGAKPAVTYWPDSDVACLQGGEVNLVQHFHPKIVINVDGKEESVPANIGISNYCLAEVHTHDGSGEIHVEAQSDKTFTLGDFFSVWGLTIERDGYQVSMTVDGNENTEMTGLVLKDLQNIVLTYTSNTPSASVEVKI